MVTSESDLLEPPSQIDEIRKRYYTNNTSILIVASLWPHQKTKFVLLFRLIYVLSLSCGTFSQVLYAFNEKWSFIEVIGNLPHILPLFCFLLCYLTLWKKQKPIKEIMDVIKEDWKGVRNREELKIMEKHARHGIFFSKCFIWMLHTVSIIFLLVPLIVHVLSLMKLVDVANTHPLPVSIEIFLDKRTYYYLITMVVIVISLLGCIVFAAITTTVSMCLVHMSSRFDIVCNRVKEAFTYNSLYNPTPKGTSKIIEILKSSIYLHTKTMRMFFAMGSIFQASFFLLTGIAVVSVCTCLFRIAWSVVRNKTDDLFMYVIIFLGQYSCMFYLNYVVQEMLNTYDNVLLELYSVEWYEAPIPVQKLILVMMSRYTSPISFDMYGAYSPSTAGFSLLTQVTMSYFTVMYSTLLS